MGEHAEAAMAREARDAGRRAMRERAALSDEQRREEGRREEAQNQAIHASREAALVAGLAVAELHRAALDDLQLQVVRVGKQLQVMRGSSQYGQWRPDRCPMVNNRRHAGLSVEAWLDVVLKQERKRYLPPSLPDGRL